MLICCIIKGMRKYFILPFVILSGVTVFCNDLLASCGAGYVLVETRQKTDGIVTAECKRLWCMDLETGNMMGKDGKPNSGYQMTVEPVLLEDAKGHSVECWGQRKWCSGETVGQWNPEYGAYTKNGADNATYMSYQKGACFAWRLERPNCPEGQTAILNNDEWICAVSSSDADGISRASSVRRTGGVRRIVR